MSDTTPLWVLELRGAIRTTSELGKYLNNVSSDTPDVLKCQITPYLINLMDKDDVSCPIRMQYIPSDKEGVVRGELDELNEETHTVPNTCVVHKYKPTALFLVTNICASYCRFCTRKRMVSVPAAAVPTSILRGSIDYIREHRIRDVLLSGGDPLMLSDTSLESLLSSLRDIPTVKTIRIGSRMVSQNPSRITPELVGMLSSFGVSLNIHINHPKEITKHLESALGMLVRAGVVVSNQSVLLRGVNDNVDTLEELYSKLSYMRVRPYYMYSCDDVVGASHFIVPYDDMRKLARSLYSRLTGMERPTFVVDTKVGKFPLDLGLLKDNGLEILVDRPEEPAVSVGEHLW